MDCHGTAAQSSEVAHHARESGRSPSFLRNGFQKQRLPRPGRVSCPGNHSIEKACSKDDVRVCEYS